jgi:hypothetical protein
VFAITRIQENKVDSKIKNPINKSRKKMLVFNCPCGAKILIVPDLPAMNKAIENHLKEHKKITGHSLSEETFAQEILIAIAEAYLPTVS